MISAIIKTIFHLSRSGVLENLTYKILKDAVSTAKHYYINKVPKDVWLFSRPSTCFSCE